MAYSLSQSSQTPVRRATPLNINALPYHSSMPQVPDYATDRESDWDSQGWYTGTGEYPRLSREDHSLMTGESLPGDPGMTHVPVQTGPYSSCTLCKLSFTKGETVGRLRCGHVFHPQCCTSGVHSAHVEDPIGAEVSCPVCHAPAQLALWSKYRPAWSTNDGRIRIEPRQRLVRYTPERTSTAVQTVRTGTRGRGRQCRPPESAPSSGAIFGYLSAVSGGESLPGEPTDMLDTANAANTVCDPEVREVDVSTHRQATARANYSKGLRQSLRQTLPQCSRGTHRERRLQKTRNSGQSDSSQSRPSQPSANSQTAPAPSVNPNTIGEHETAAVVLPQTWADADAWNHASSHLLAPPFHRSGLDRPVLPHRNASQVYSGAINGPGQSSNFHRMTRLTDGRHSVMIDSGTVGNLVGEYTAYDMVQRIRRAGLTTRTSLPAGDRNPYVFDRSQPLNISGVGPGSISCDRDCRLPLALNQVGLGSVPASFRAPIIPNSHLPPLLGIDTLRAYRSIIDTNTSRIYLLGSGTYDIESHLPRGTIFLQGEVVPSGHLVIPSDGYAFEIGEIPGGNKDAAAGRRWCSRACHIF